MGVNYCQYCILGIKVKIANLKHIISPAEYADQARYDTRTGKQISTERVLVKEEDYEYRFMGYSGDSDLFYTLPDDLGLGGGVDQDGEFFYMGYKIGDDTDYGRVEMLCGSLSLDDIQEKISELAPILNVDLEQIQLHFFSYEG